MKNTKPTFFKKYLSWLLTEVFRWLTVQNKNYIQSKHKALLPKQMKLIKEIRMIKKCFHVISLVSWLHKNYLTSMSSPLTISGLKPATIINLSTIKVLFGLGV